MRKLFIICAFLAFFNVKSQSDLTFYHMGAATPQSMMMNPSFFPDAEFYFSFPVISGTNLNYNNGLTYNQIMSPIAGTDSVKVDLELALENLKEGDNIRFVGDISIFQFGIRAGDKNFSLFSNVRYSGGFVYPVQFLNYFVNGNGNFIGQRIEESNIKGGGIAYHEIGLGYSQELRLSDMPLKVGGRVKLLQGIAHASTSEDASITMFTEEGTYDLSVQFNSATFRTAGFNALYGEDASSYLISNSNKGWGVDLGAQLDINDRWTGLISVNDLGFIKWKEDIENYTLTNNQVTLGGFDNLDDVDIEQALEDSLDTWTQYDSTGESFTTPIGSRMMLGANYKVTENGFVSGTLIRNGASYRSSTYGFGVGYTHQVGKTLTVSTTILKEEARPVKVGGGFMVRVGLLQLYGSFNDLLNATRDPADVQGVDFRLGLNFLIGRHNTGKKALKPKKEEEELSPFPPEYDLDHLLDSEEEDN